LTIQNAEEIEALKDENARLKRRIKIENQVRERS